MDAFINNKLQLVIFCITSISILVISLLVIFTLQPLLVDHTDENIFFSLTAIILVIAIGLFIYMLVILSIYKKSLVVMETQVPAQADSVGVSVLREALDIIPAGIVIYAANDELVICNKKFREIWNYSLEDAAPGVTHQELGLIDIQQGAKVAGEVAENYMQSRLEYRSEFSEEQVVELPDGRLISTKDRPLAEGGFISIQNDITELVMARNRYRRSEQQLLDAIEGLDEGFVFFDNDDRLVIANSNYRKLFPGQTEISAGASFEDTIRDSVYRREISSAIGCEEEWIARRLEQHHQQSQVDEIELSSGIWLKVSERHTANGGVVCIYTDISELKRNQATLELYATTDDLTGILNRRTGLIMLDKMISQYQRSKDELSICYFDIDGLKQVNDRFGHQNGDVLIKTVSHIAQQTIREGDIIMRLGGDEFMIIFADCSEDLAYSRMQAIKQQLKQVKQKQGFRFDLDFSYGVVSYSYGTYETAEEFVAEADRLMYQNKLTRKAAS